MRYVQPEGKNADFGKPKDWDDSAFGPCGSLPIRREVVGAGGNAYAALYSNWKPSTAELALLNAGGVVELQCCGVQPAVAVSVVPCADPNESPEPITEQWLRNQFADELMKFGNHACDVAAQSIRSANDNSFAGTATIAIMKKLVGLA